MMRKEEKTAIIEQYATHPGDTGSPEVQIAVLTSRINELTGRPRENGRASVPAHDNSRRARSRLPPLYACARKPDRSDA